MYSMLVPAEEQKLYNDPNTNTVMLKYALSQRDYFDFNEEVNQNAYGQKSILTQDIELGDEEHYLLSLACQCSIKGQPISLRENKSESFTVRLGQAENSDHFQYSKAQSQVVKELVDLGMTSLGSHYCETCSAKAMESGQFCDFEKYCLVCALEHRAEHPSHQMVLILTPQLLQNLLKKSEAFEVQVR